MMFCVCLTESMLYLDGRRHFNQTMEHWMQHNACPLPAKAWQNRRASVLICPVYQGLSLNTLKWWLLLHLHCCFIFQRRKMTGEHLFAIFYSFIFSLLYYYYSLFFCGYYTQTFSLRHSQCLQSHLIGEPNVSWLGHICHLYIMCFLHHTIAYTHKFC